ELIVLVGEDACALLGEADRPLVKELMRQDRRVYLCERSLRGGRGLFGDVFVELERDDAVADVIPTPGRRRLLAREDVRPACLAVEVGAEEERARGAGAAFGPRPLRSILPRASANLDEANRGE